MAEQVKRAFKYRFYPTDEQAAELSRTFGCVRLVYNKVLEERTRAWYGEQRRISYVQSSAALTEWKKTEELAFLTEVSSVPLQQARRTAHAGQDGAAPGHPLVAPPARGSGTDHGDRVPGRGGTLVRVPAVRGHHHARPRDHECGRPGRRDHLPGDP